MTGFWLGQITGSFWVGEGVEGEGEGLGGGEAVATITFQLPKFCVA